jgi:hypothetical protein
MIAWFGRSEHPTASIFAGYSACFLRIGLNANQRYRMR